MTTRSYMYSGFVRTLSERVKLNLGTIEIGHNFDYGPEFEIVMCEALRSVLPDRFGVNRGYLVAEDGARAGDDIVVSARERFPTLALRGHDNFARKEFVPIEAAYCYVEAKHSIVLEGDGPQSLRFACGQVSAAKKLCTRRKAVGPEQIAPYLTVASALVAKTPPGFPTLLNPMFGVVFARHVRRTKDSAPIDDPKEIVALLEGEQIKVEAPADIVVLGENVVIYPAIAGRVLSPFFIDGQSTSHTCIVDGVAFGLAFASIMFAIDWIQLGVLPWPKIIVDGLCIPFE